MMNRCSAVLFLSLCGVAGAVVSPSQSLPLPMLPDFVLSCE